MFAPAVRSGLSAFASSSLLVAHKRDEDATWRGGNLIVAKISQIAECFLLLEQLDYLETFSGRRYLPFPLRFFVYLSPCLYPLSGIASAAAEFVGALRGQEEASADGPSDSWKSVAWRIARYVLRQIDRHVGSICHAAALTVNAALLYFGSPAYALTSLGVLAFGYLERRQCLSKGMRVVYQTTVPWMRGVAGLLGGSWLCRCLIAVNWTMTLANWCAAPRHQRIPYEPLPGSPLLNSADFARIIAKEVSLEVKRDHIWISPFPLILSPGEKFPEELRNRLRGLLEAFDWEADFELLDGGLERDGRWPCSDEYAQLTTSSEATPEERIRRLKIDYVKKQFSGLVDSVIDENIQTGEPLHYGVLQNYLAYLAKHLPYPEKRDPSQKPSSEQMMLGQILRQLALEGGDLCGPGVYTQLENAAVTLLVGSPVAEGAERPRLPLKRRLLLLLQQERLKLVQALHLRVAKLNPIYMFLTGGTGDVHAMNRTIALFADDFGLPDQGADEDGTVERGPLVKWYTSNVVLVGQCNPEDVLWNDTRAWKDLPECKGYTPTRIVELVKDIAGTPLLSHSEVYDWARQWAETAIGDEEEREKFLMDLQEAPFETFGGKFTQEFLEAMLVDMGILSIKLYFAKL